MSNLRISLWALSIGLFVVPVVLRAQNDPPPHCCPRSPDVVPSEDNAKPLVIQSEFSVSPAMLQLQGITRSQFIDRLSESLFAGKQVALVVSSKNILSLADPDVRSRTETTAPNEEGLIAIQETRLYWLPRNRLNSEQLDKLDQVSITDGEVYIKISFSQSALSNVELLLPPTQWP